MQRDAERCSELAIPCEGPNRCLKEDARNTFCLMMVELAVNSVFTVLMSPAILCVYLLGIYLDAERSEGRHSLFSNRQMKHTPPGHIRHKHAANPNAN